jgi:hypothetical protein
MPIEGSETRETLITVDHLRAFRRGLEALQRERSFEVHGGAIDDLVLRSGDTYLWHTEPGAALRESNVLRRRVEGTGIDSQARLAHGALGLLYVLETAYLQNPDLAIRGVADVRYIAPVFEGTRMTAHVEREHEGEAAFEVMSDALEPGLAITGRILYAPLEEPYDADTFTGLAEQQLFTLEESIGLLSALIGLWVQGVGGRVLYMGQETVLGGLLRVGDRLHAAGTIEAGIPGRRGGIRTTTRATLDRERGGGHEPVASGESIFLYMDLEPVG